MNFFERELVNRVKDLQNLEKMDKKRIKNDKQALSRAKKSGDRDIIAVAKGNLQGHESALKKTKADLKVAKQALSEFRKGR